MAETPRSCQSHQIDYEPSAWEAYTLSELGNWVYLLTKRAEHRTNLAKKDKDLHDAQNYLNMMQSKLNAVKELTLENFAKHILKYLSSPDIVLSGTPGTGESLVATFKIRDDSQPKGFDEMYTLYVRPALEALAQSLSEYGEVFELQMVDGSRTSVVKSKTMAARFNTHYDSDKGGGPDAGIVMTIEVGVK